MANLLFISVLECYFSNEIMLISKIFQVYIANISRVVFQSDHTLILNPWIHVILIRVILGKKRGAFGHN